MIRVYADVVGDLFHVGHLNLFRQARKFGDYLLVGVHSDESVESYKRMPIFNQSDRYDLIKNCRLVDDIVKDAPLVLTEKFINKHSIDIVVHGDDTSSHFEKQHKIPLEMGIMRYLKYTEGVSTTEIINKIRG